MADEPQEEAERGRGRPTAYEPEFAKQAAKLCDLGATDDELADFFEVHRSTIYRWKHEHDDFCDAVKTGKETADERVERSLYQKATGYNVTEEQAVKLKVEQYKEEVEVVQVEKHVPADTTAAIFWLKNRRSGNWRDKTEQHNTHDLSPEAAKWLGL
jgi:transposase